MTKCPSCGAEIEFDPSMQEVICKFCNNSYSIEELNNVNLDSVQGAKEDNDKFSGETYKCNQCGATLMTFDDTAITFCSYCGSQAILKDKMISVIKPDFVIPFSKSKQECIDVYKRKVNGFIFAPSYLKSDLQVDKFRGIYMPYAVFNFYKKGLVKCNAEKYRGRVGNYEYYDKYLLESDVDISYDGISFDLVSKFYDNFSTSIPFDYKKAVPFNLNYLHGFYADSFDVSKANYTDVAKEIAYSDATKRLKSNSTLARYKADISDLNLMSDNKIGMFPVYFLATRDKNQENVHYAAVNGQTGKVACDLPISFGKYVGISLILSLIIFLLINNSLVLTPTRVAVFAFVMCIINLFISKSQVSKIESREKHLDDIGFLEASGQNALRQKLASAMKTSGEYEYNREIRTIKQDLRLYFILILIFTITGVAVIRLPALFSGSTIHFSTADILISFLCTLLFFSVPVIGSISQYCMAKKSHKYAFSNPTQKKEKIFGRNFKYYYKMVIGIIISLVAIISMQANDLYYYGTAFAALTLVLLSFYDLVKEHNLLTSNKLPQLNERGGNK